MFNPVDTKQNFPKLEEEILKFWQDNKVFEKSVDQRNGAEDFVFYDGPPFATGLPHYGHILAGTMKDVVPRYWTMRGKRVERRFGWDCHGLPIEYEVEKELGLKGRKDITDKYGVPEFSEKCRSVVQRYAGEWRETVERMGRWVDMDNDYKTMDPSFMESIWWVFGQLWEKGLVYQGHKAMHVCPRCVTPLSNFEVTLGYADVKDMSVIWKFKVVGETNTYLLAWTTTPWSTPSTMGLSVSPEATYVKVKIGDEHVIFVKDRLDFVMKGTDESNYEIVDEFKGKKIVGLNYEPIVDFYRDHDDVKGNKNVYKTHAADYVELDTGTGIVTINGSYGEVDLEVAKKNELPVLMDVAPDGIFEEFAGYLKGMYVKDGEKVLIKNVKDMGLVWREESYTHSYPHCWRCDSPLLNYATTSWFVKVEEIKKKMLEENAKVHWVPDHVGMGRFNDWLENARDWCVSRNRFWGTPLPIWESQDDDKDRVCIGSIEQLEELSGKKVEDLHKHLIDDITFEKDGKTYKRIEEVFDCWFESGSMPYAQMHYPFENKEKFEKNFPAQYIAEGLDQTRGWFYTLVVLGTALFGTAPFKNCVVNGMILAEDGKKMSKRLKNYPEPGLIFDKYGADALRFYLMNSPVVKAEALRFSEKGVENVVKSVILPIWNSYSFFVTYANIDKWDSRDLVTDPSKLSNKLDKWLLSELHTLIKEVTEQMDDYNLQAIRPIYTFIERLTNWYIRRSRRRFWKSDTDDQDKNEAYSTLYTVLVQLSKVMAPVMPYISESMYKNLTEGESVHLENWPEFDEKFIDHELNKEIELIMDVAKLGNTARARAKVKTRQPLGKVTIGVTEDLIKYFNDDQKQVLAEELNVKEVIVANDPTDIAQAVISPDARLLGPKYGADVQFIIKEARQGNYELLENGNLQVAQFELLPEEFNLGFKSKEGEDVESDKGIVVALDTNITDELKAEGVTREIVRYVQELRKESNLEVSDRIRLNISANDEILNAVKLNDGYVESETLAESLTFGNDQLAHVKSFQVDGSDATISLELN